MSTKGLTFYVCFGGYSKFGLIKDGASIRLILGWVSLAIIMYDLEVVISLLSKRIQHLEKIKEQYEND